MRYLFINPPQSLGCETLNKLRHNDYKLKINQLYLNNDSQSIFLNLINGTSEEIDLTSYLIYSNTVLKNSKNRFFIIYFNEDLE